MTAEELRALVKESGIVGAGGAGFPTYMKIDKRANTILMNCAECEPLLMLHRQLLKAHTREILSAFSRIAEVVGAGEAIIGIKQEYEDTIEALLAYLPSFPGIHLHLLTGSYPMGDEVVLIYEATGKVVSPGGLPIEAGIAVFNVETVYNIYRALEQSAPVTDKLVTVAGEVAAPITVRVPVGTSFQDVVSMAGGETHKDAAYLIGGPMMGKIGTRYEQVTKTTNAILVLPGDHIIIRKKKMPASIGMKRAASACCQCQMCTDLCPRHNLGHPIEPHKFMRAASSHDFHDLEVFMNLFFCSGCGLCEMFSCPQSLSPRTLIEECKTGMRCAGVKPQVGAEAVPVRESREYRKVPEKRLEARLGLAKYDKEAIFYDHGQFEHAQFEHIKPVRQVRLLFSQHIGAPAICRVRKGEEITRGQIIAGAADGLSVPVHASISGIVTDITEKYVEISER